jgi:hypothetical protein
VKGCQIASLQFGGGCEQPKSRRHVLQLPIDAAGNCNGILDGVATKNVTLAVFQLDKQQGHERQNRQRDRQCDCDEIGANRCPRKQS